MSEGKASAWWKVMALAMGLPSLMVGTFFGLYVLVQKNIISLTLLLIILLVVIANTFFFMVRYGLVRKNRE
jgi:hypothetical protein